MTATDTCSRPSCDRPRYAFRGTGLCLRHFQLTDEHQPYGDLHPYPHHIIDPLLEQGYTLGGISFAAGLATHHLGNSLAAGLGVRDVTLRRLEQLDPDTIGKQPGWRVTRRVRALLANGARLSEISEGTGLSVSALTAISSGIRQTVQRDTFIRIRDFYTEHEFDLPRPPGNRVANAGWEPPMHWANIDDPKEDWHGRAMVTTATIHGYLRLLREEGMTWAEVGEVFEMGGDKACALLQKDTIQRKVRDRHMSAWYRYRFRETWGNRTKQGRAAA